MLSGVVAVAVGLAPGWLSNKLMRLLGDATPQIGLSSMVPFVSTADGRELEMAGWGPAIVVVVGVRVLWLLPATWAAKRLHNRRHDHDEEIPMTWRETVVLWWAGMRGSARTSSTTSGASGTRRGWTGSRRSSGSSGK